VRDGCGRGWHRHHWRDQWGYWHGGDCVPDEGRPYGGWGAGPYNPPPFGAAPLNHGVGVTHTKRFARTTFGRRRSRTPDPPASGQAREDFAVILDELAFLREPLARLPDPRRVRWIVLRAALGALAAIGAVAPVLVW